MKIKYATADEPGSVVVFDKESKQEICEEETTKVLDEKIEIKV